MGNKLSKSFEEFHRMMPVAHSLKPGLRFALDKQEWNVET
jgi:hypothetical protein